MRSLVGELGGEKWKTIAERLGTGRTGHAVEQKWAREQKLMRQWATKNAVAPAATAAQRCERSRPSPSVRVAGGAARQSDSTRTPTPAAKEKIQVKKAWKLVPTRSTTPPSSSWRWKVLSSTASGWFSLTIGLYHQGFEADSVSTIERNATQAVHKSASCGKRYTHVTRQDG